jgi:hypothetical protein
MSAKTSSSPKKSYPRRIASAVLLALALLGCGSLLMKQGRLLVMGEAAMAKVVGGGTGKTGWELRFTTARGQEVLCQVRATMGTVLQLGEVHAIRYLPGEPTLVTLTTLRQLWAPIVVGLGFSCLCAMAGWVLWIWD